VDRRYADNSFCPHNVLFALLYHYFHKTHYSINSTFSLKRYSKCAPPALTRAAEMTTLWLLHSDIRITHATVVLGVVINRTKVRNVWQKLIYYCFQSIKLLLQFFSQLFFLYFKGHTVSK